MIFENTGKKSWNELDDNTKGILLLAYYEGKEIQEWWDDEKGQEWEDVEKNCYDPPEWEYGIWRIKPEPVKEVSWMNDFGEEGGSMWHDNRDDLIGSRIEEPIAVIRREIVDGVVSYYKEDV